MFFQIALGPNLPAFSVVVAESGQLFVKLIDIGILLEKKNPYEYRDRFKPIAVVARDVVSVRGFKIPYQTLTTHLVSVPMACYLINEERPDLGKSFLECFSNGYACKFGMRKFVTSSKKSPMLIYMEERNEKCVYVPEWIQDFVKDLQLYRAEVLKEECSVKRKCEKLDRKCKKKPSFMPLEEESSSSLIIDENTMLAEPMLETPFEIKQEPEAEPIPRFKIKLEPEAEPIPRFKIKQEPEAEPIPRFKIKQEPEAEPIPRFKIKQELEAEPIPRFKIKQEPEVVQRPPFEIKQEPPFEIKQSPTESVPVAVVKLNTSGLLMTEMFPTPGDLIVKFKDQPVRVWFLKGENDEMYHVRQ